MVKTSEGEMLVLGFLFLFLTLAIAGIVLWEMKEEKKWEKLRRKFRKESGL